MCVSTLTTGNVMYIACRVKTSICPAGSVILWMLVFVRQFCKTDYVLLLTWDEAVGVGLHTLPGWAWRHESIWNWSMIVCVKSCGGWWASLNS